MRSTLATVSVDVGRTITDGRAAVSPPRAQIMASGHQSRPASARSASSTTASSHALRRRSRRLSSMPAFGTKWSPARRASGSGIGLTGTRRSGTAGHYRRSSLQPPPAVTDVRHVFCDDCGRVLNRATGRCVCADDANLRVPVMVGASASDGTRGAPLMPLRGEPLPMTFAEATRAPAAPPAVRKAPFVIPRAALDEGLVDVLVYDDAIVLSHDGLDNESAAPDATSVGGHLRRTQHR